MLMDASRQSGAYYAAAAVDEGDEDVSALACWQTRDTYYKSPFMRVQSMVSVYLGK